MDFLICGSTNFDYAICLDLLGLRTHRNPKGKPGTDPAASKIGKQRWNWGSTGIIPQGCG